MNQSFFYPHQLALQNSSAIGKLEVESFGGIEICLSLLFLVYAFIIAYRFGFVRTNFKLLLKTKEQGFLFESGRGSNSELIAFILGLFVCIISIYISSAHSIPYAFFPNASNFSSSIHLFAFISCFVFSVCLCKSILAIVCNAIFEESSLWREFVEVSRAKNLVFFIICFPLAFIAFRFAENLGVSSFVLNTIGIIYLFCIVVQIINCSLRFKRYSNFPLLYIFLYICGLEIIPLLCFYKFFCNLTA